MILARFYLQYSVFFADTKTEDDVPLFNAAIFAAMLFAFRIFDGVTDPLAGYISDNLDLIRVLKSSAPSWDGGYSIGGLVGNGDMYHVRLSLCYRGCSCVVSHVYE